MTLAALVAAWSLNDYFAVITGVLWAIVGLLWLVFGRE